MFKTVKKNGFVPLVIILIIAILGAIGYFGSDLFRVKNVTKLITPDSKISPENLIKEIHLETSEKVLEQSLLDKKLIEMSKNNEGTFYWPIPNSYVIKVSSSPQFVLKQYCSGEAYPNEFNNVAPILVKDIEKILQNYKFEQYEHREYDAETINYLNTQSGLKCQIQTVGCGGMDSEHMYQYLNVVCNSNDVYETNYTSQITALVDMEVKEGFLEQLSNYGDYYLFNYRFPFGGSNNLVAKKSGEHYSELIAGQEYFDCEILNKYKIPHQLGSPVDKCYDSNNSLIDNSN